MATDPNSALFALLAQLTGNSGAYQQQTGPGYSYGYPQGYGPYGYQSPYGYQGVPSGYNQQPYQQPYGYNPYSQGYSPYYQPYQQPPPNQNQQNTPIPYHPTPTPYRPIPPNQNTQSAPPWMGSVGVPAVGTQPSSAPPPGGQGNAPAQDPNAYINSLIATLTGNQQPAYGNASTGPSQGSTWNYGVSSADPGNPGPISLNGGAVDAGHIGSLNGPQTPSSGSTAAGPTIDPNSTSNLYGTNPNSTASTPSSSSGSFNAADPWGSVSNRKPEMNSSWSGLWGG